MSEQGKPAQTSDISSAIAVHPIIASLEKADAATIVIEGFVGTSQDAVVRLYPALDASDYVEIPKQAVVYIDTDKQGGPGAVRAFVRASSEILSVQRLRLPAGNYMPALPPGISRQPRMCADFCEDSFKSGAVRYYGKLFEAQQAKNEVRAAQLYAAAGSIRNQIESALRECLLQCARRNPGQFFFGIDSTYSAILARTPLPALPD